MPLAELIDDGEVYTQGRGMSLSCCFGFILGLIDTWPALLIIHIAGLALWCPWQRRVYAVRPWNDVEDWERAVA